MNDSSTDIAIIGMAGLFPGARDMQAYWHNIVNKVYSIEDAPEEWVGPYFEPNPQSPMDPSRIYTRKVGLLKELSEFNPLEFGIPPKHAEGDPGHYLALKLARDALQDAGYTERPFNREKAGIILGRGVNPNRAEVTGTQYGVVIDQTMSLIQQLLPQLDADTFKTLRQELVSSLPTVSPDLAPGLVSNVASGRIANRLDLMGPNYLIDAACSSTLIAIELAMKELLSERCDLMLAGGVQGTMPPQVYQLFCQLQALSREQVRPFDRNASGTLLSEGVGFFALRRLQDAVRDGDRIYAVIKGIGLSSDGKALGLLAPRLEGEILAIKRVYEQTGIDPATIELIEAHGTGIPLGDQTEIKALTHVFGHREGPMPRVAIGSVKSMIGHCIPASGVASVIKTSLSLHYKTLPPTLCDEVNPALGIEKTPFYINTETRPWIHSEQTPRRAGVNAFGFGGINAHAILEEYRGTPETESKTVVFLSHRQQKVWQNWPTELLVLSAQTSQALKALIEKIQHFIEVKPDVPLASLACTFSQYPPGPYRLALIAKSTADLQQKLSQAVEKLVQSKAVWRLAKSKVYYGANQTPLGKTAFLFSSEGSQYSNMLADLCLYFPQVRAWFDFLDEAFADRALPPSRTIFPSPTGLTPEQRDWANQQLFAGDVATESIFAASMALNELLRDLGIHYEMVLGHSAGENVAGRASGMAHYASRSQFMEQLRHLNQIYSDLEAADNIPKGVLLSVGAVDDSVIRQLLDRYPDSLYLVADNCPSQAILFAKLEVSEIIANHIKEVGGICIPLPFNRAYHTPLFEVGVDVLRSHYQMINPGSSDACLYSCSTTEPYPSDVETARSIAAAQWAKPVRFRETIEKLYERGVRTFIEVGPSSNLTAFVDNILRGRDYTALPTNTQRQSGLEQIQELLAQLFVRGISVNFAPLYQHRDIASVDIEDIASVAKQKGTTILDHSIPLMSFRPEFVQEIQRKLQQSGQAVAISQLAGMSATSNHQPPLPQLENFQPSAKDAEPTVAPFIPQLPEEPLPNTTPSAAEDDPHLLALEGHFGLMQEFLAHQGRVAAVLFSGQFPEDESPSDELTS
jgi:acyl transferase domain-containing protein